MWKEVALDTCALQRCWQKQHCIATIEGQGTCSMSTQC